MSNILITGASRGLGAACARAFAEDGHTLMLTARDCKALEEVKAGCDCDCVTMGIDLLFDDSPRMIVEMAHKWLSRIDCVLHCAGGGYGLNRPLIKLTDIEKLFRLNVSAGAEINGLIATDMQHRGSGNIVHIGSIAGTEATGSVGYNTVKAALSGYVRTLGRDLAKDGVVVTGILPGGFRAPGNSWERKESTSPSAVEDFIAKRLPRKRLADVSELIPLIKFLCSDEASMMGGCMVPIDAGEGLSYV